MKVLGIILIIAGSLGLILAGMMFGDIGIAALIGAIPAILSGVGFLMCNKTLKTIAEKITGN
jgi:uncharacterized membrane protein